MKKYQLPKEFGEKWLVALRSDEYKQTKGRLCNNLGYCCLGVAGIINGYTKNDLGDFGVFNEAFSNMPQLLIGPKFDCRNLFVEHVTGMNDDGKPFSEIADWIEQNVEFI